MVESNKVFLMSRSVHVEVQAAFREFRSIKELKDEQSVIVEVVYLDSDQKPISIETQSIDGQYYELLMSESPDFATGKPANEYREADIWHVIDLMSAN